MDKIHLWLVDHNQPAAPPGYFYNRWSDVVNEKVDSFFNGVIAGLMLSSVMFVVISAIFGLVL